MKEIICNHMDRHKTRRFYLGNLGPLCPDCVEKANQILFWLPASQYYNRNKFEDNCWYDQEEQCWK